MDGSLFDKGQLLIYRYLPGEMLPEDMDDVTLSDFYGLVAKARVSRKMLQEDQETAIVAAICRIFESE